MIQQKEGHMSTQERKSKSQDEAKLASTNYTLLQWEEALLYALLSYCYFFKCTYSYPFLHSLDRNRTTFLGLRDIMLKGISENQQNAFLLHYVLDYLTKLYS